MGNVKDMQQLPVLQEFRFPSKTPLIGPLISLIRRFLYGLTAKWGVWAVIQQQNRINQTIEEQLHRQEEQLHKEGELLMGLDRDLAFLARTVAEIEIRQRYLAKILETSRTCDQNQQNV